jgi:hypothetical protein
MVAAFTLSRKGSLERFRPRRLLRPRSPLSCHPERSEGSAFRLSPLHAFSFNAFSSSDVCPFNFKLSSACPERSRRVNFPPLTPFPATLTSHLQLAENKTTLSPAVATLTSRVKPKSFACHSYRKHLGWGYAIFNFFVAQTSVCVLLRQSASQRSAANDLQELENLAVHQIPSHESAFTASALFLPPVKSHQSQITKSCRIRTYAKRASNSSRIRTSKTQHLKPFRINTYKKTGRGDPEGSHRSSQSLLFRLHSRWPRVSSKRASIRSEGSLWKPAEAFVNADSGEGTVVRGRKRRQVGIG